MRSQLFQPHCTVVVCTRNRPDYLKCCLEALQLLRYPCFETIVVDNAPSDAGVRKVAEQFSVRYVVEHSPGLSRARNAGLRAAHGEIVAYIDDDAIADPNWLDHLVPEFENPAVMAVTGRLMLPPDGQADFPAFGDLGPSRRTVDLSTPKWFEMASFGGMGQGSNMAFRRSSIAFWRGFDERLGRGAPIDGGEEHLAFYELIARGSAVVYTPLAVVFHRGDASGDGASKRYIAGLRTASAYLQMLLWESNHRLRALRYLVEALFRVERTWRVLDALPDKPSCSPWQKVIAYLNGLICYLRSGPRFRGSGRPDL